MQAERAALSGLPAPAGLRARPGLARASSAEQPALMAAACLFCEIAAGSRAALVVAESPAAVAFLDYRPLFPGHVLLVPRAHHETLMDLPVDLLQPLFAEAQRVGAALERGLGAEGVFVAINNRVSQSVAHLHVHLVPRRRKDGLKGFFWPRVPYRDAAQAEETAARIRAALA